MQDHNDEIDEQQEDSITHFENEMQDALEHSNDDKDEDE